ncbi:MAG: nucleotide exchange factor GrpE [Spirochaetales bacterium]|nr:nucleotide exchange factor GrpE [Spirochaetales bacterium]
MGESKDNSKNQELKKDEVLENAPLEQSETQTTEALDEGEKPAEAASEDDLLTVYAAKIKELEEENSELKDQLLRKQADFENFRKRLSRDKDESIKYANSMLLLDLTTIIDDFERAIKSSEDSQDFKTLHDGIQMIEKRLVSELENKWGLIRFNSQNEEFDPERHQAIAMEESSETDKAIVLEDYQKGYMFHERVLRPAKVKVAQPAASSEQE